jgi:hypothetical protein
MLRRTHEVLEVKILFHINKLIAVKNAYYSNSFRKNSNQK